jgi:hypothetical protein
VGPALAPADVVPLDVAPPDVAPPDVVPLLDWLALAPFEVTEPDGDADADLDGLALVDVAGGVLTLGLAVLVGLADEPPHGLPGASAFGLSVALGFAAAEAFVEVVAEGLVVAVSVGLAVVELVGVVLSVGLAPLLVGLALALLLAGLVTVAAGRALGLADLVTLLEGDGEEPDAHAVTVTRAGLETLVGVIPPADSDSRLPGPAALGALLPLWEEVIPAAWPSWTKAWRSGGTARATPTANRAQAAASAGRSSPSRQSRG